MNIKRGLFRLWVVISLLYAGGVTYLSFPALKYEYEMRAEAALPAGYEIMVPVLCGDAKGTINVDYDPETKVAEPNPFDTCYYEMAKFRRLFQEYQDLSDNEIYAKTYEGTGETVPYIGQPWQRLGFTALLAFAPPLAVLLIGGAFVWAFAGFARRPA